MKKLSGYSVDDNINCPICSANCNNQVLSSYSITETAAYFCPPQRNRERYERLVQSLRSLWKQETCYLAKCNNCSFAFGYPHVGGDEQFYSILHEQYGYPGWRTDYDLAIEKVLQKYRGGSILDIGAGTGNFLRSLDESWEKFAVEGSDITRELLIKVRINTYPGLPELIEAKKHQFQVITMFQVLEHIAGFEQVIKDCRQLLVTGGRLVISVPDGDDMIRQEELLNCPDYPPNHINKWTVKSLSLALAQQGFLVEGFVNTPGSVKELLSALHVKLIGRAAQQPGSWAAKAYTIKTKKLRVPVLALLSLVEAIRLLPHLRELYKGRTLVVYAQAT